MNSENETLLLHRLSDSTFPLDARNLFLKVNTRMSYATMIRWLRHFREVGLLESKKTSLGKRQGIYLSIEKVNVHKVTKYLNALSEVRA